MLDAGAWPLPGMPNVLVYVPASFRRLRPLHVIMWLHGYSNCVENVVRDADGECTPDAGVRSAHHLAAQLEASGRDALLIVPELDFESPGSFAMPNSARALLIETFAHLRKYLGELRIENLAPIIVAAHSAGNDPAANIVSAGGLTVAEVWHLDSLYGEIPVYVAWIQSQLPSFEGSPARCRFADIYTHEWGTEDNSLNLAETANSNWLPDAGAVVDDRTLNEISDAELRHGLVFKLSDLSHDDVARIWFGRLLSTSNLP